jgi:hypothetical protein
VKKSDLSPGFLDGQSFLRYHRLHEQKTDFYKHASQACIPDSKILYKRGALWGFFQRKKTIKKPPKAVDNFSSPTLDGQWI